MTVVTRPMEAQRTAARDGRPLHLVTRLLLLGPLLAGIGIASIDPFSTVFFAVYAGTGYVLAIRRPRQLLGWLLIGIAFGFLGTTVPLDLDPVALVANRASWRDFLFVWAGAWSGYGTFSGFVALMIVFPSGHLPVRGRRRAQALPVACAGLCVVAATAPFVAYNPNQDVASVLVPNRFAILPASPVWRVVPVDLLIVPMVVAMAMGIGWMLARYRRATGVERLQLRWLVASLAALVVAVTAGLLSLVVIGDIGGLAWLPAAIGFTTVPFAILRAVMRHRLYEIDRLVGRTVSWLLLTGVLGAVFGAAVIGLQAILAPVTANNTVAVAASTLLAATLFQPVRRRVQRLVDRRFNRARLDAERVAAHFAGHVRDEVDLASLRRELEGTVHDAVAPTSLGVWLRAPAERS